MFSTFYPKTYGSGCGGGHLGKSCIERFIDVHTVFAEILMIMTISSFQFSKVTQGLSAKGTLVPITCCKSIKQAGFQYGLKIESSVFHVSRDTWINT